MTIPPQFPESTQNLRGRFVLRNRDMELARSNPQRKPTSSPTASSTPDVATASQSGVDPSQVDERWSVIEATLRPARLIRLCQEFARDFPGSDYDQQVKVRISGAQMALDSQRSAGLSSDLFDESAGDQAYRDDLTKALRGNKDAAHRIAMNYRNGGSGVLANLRRAEQWLRFAAELGNGIASWELSVVYNQSGQVADAARFEKKAQDLGYQPPLRLSSRGY